jgi:hypothetical protein
MFFWVLPSRLAHGEDDASWRLRWVSRKRAGLTVYTFDVHHPTRGWALKGGLRNEPVFGGRLLNSSAAGIRGRQASGYEKLDGRPRILVFGDSFTFGEEVGDDETYSHFLEQMLGGIEVLNCGVEGYGHDQMLLYLKGEGVRYRPDIVILGFVGQDMQRNLLEFRDFAKPRFALQGGRLVLKNTPVPTPAELLDDERHRSRALDLLEMLQERVRWRLGINDLAMERVTTAILKEFRLVTEQAGAVPVFAYLPVAAEISGPEGGSKRAASFFAEFCHSHGIRGVDLRPAFWAEVRNGLPLKTDGHWDRREHHIAARALAEYLLGEGILRGGVPALGPHLPGDRPSFPPIRSRDATLFPHDAGKRAFNLVGDPDRMESGTGQFDTRDAASVVRQGLQSSHDALRNRQGEACR